MTVVAEIAGPPRPPLPASFALSPHLVRCSTLLIQLMQPYIPVLSDLRIRSNRLLTVYFP